jgi:FtsZ-interacting cell division protein ZipA
MIIIGIIVVVVLIITGLLFYAKAMGLKAREEQLKAERLKEANDSINTTLVSINKTNEAIKQTVSKQNAVHIVEQAELEKGLRNAFEDDKF